MEITKKMRDNVKSYIVRTGTTAKAVAKEMKFTEQTLGEWLSDDGYPKEPTASRVSKFLMWYNDHIEKVPHSATMASAKGNPYVPVMGTARAASYEPALEALDEYLNDPVGDMAMFPCEVKPGWFALRVEGDSMSPDYPDGTMLLIGAGEFPQRGDEVVARIADEQTVVVKRYQRKNGTVSLESLNPAGKSYSWDVKEKPGYVLWMWPVIQAVIDIRKRRWEKSKNGGDQ